MPREFTIVLKDSEATIDYAAQTQAIEAARQLWNELRNGSVVHE